jgi:cell division septation protein DedD
MRLDYNDKKGGRETVERKPLPKNRPRKEPVGMFALLSVLVLVLTFGAGVATGWFFFKFKGNAAPAAVVAQPVKQVEPAPPPHQAGQPGQPGQPAPEPPLTFYKTLPAGGKGVMGSGMNLKLPAAAPAAPRTAPAAPQAPPQPQGAKQESQDKPEGQEKAENQEKQEKPEKQELRYLVQIASYRDKQEADQAQAKLSAKGMAVYVVESRLADKSVWYRLRIGRHLTKAEAEQLAAKAGKGSAVIAE